MPWKAFHPSYGSPRSKTMRMVLNNNRRVNILKSDLHAIVNQGALDIPRKLLQNNFRSMDELESNMELKCLNNLISLLGTSTDVSVFLNCVSSNLQAFVFQPSRSKEEFIRLAASFQLRWNFLLTSVSKAMTLCHTDSFGSWHLFNLLLLEYVIHILQSCIEDEEEEEDGSNLKEMQPNDTSPLQSAQEPLQSPDSSPIKQHGSQDDDDEPPRVTLKHISQSDVCLSSIILKVLGFLVDTATGNKLIQVLLEDKATKSTVKLDLPVGQEALVTLKDGQKFVIHTSDVLQSPEDVYFRETNANI
ncbi:DNA-binding protein RFX8 [Gracilinanus agilis]|uniref:DNA-binding protein RFX8 n=1 Tax=Gracilinanus agilis TaxID=191870 RepID=UPI001CFDD5AB|nr:DNA-binding protein RFX8 [Gracilinanus agilis]